MEKKLKYFTNSMILKYETVIIMVLEKHIAYCGLELS